MRPKKKAPGTENNIGGRAGGDGVTEDKFRGEINNGLSGKISELLPIGPHDVPIINCSAVTKLVRIEKEGWNYGGKCAP